MSRKVFYCSVVRYWGNIGFPVRGTKNALTQGDNSDFFIMPNDNTIDRPVRNSLFGKIRKGFYGCVEISGEI